MSTKKCSKCNSLFECTNEKMGCWCEDLILDAETLKKLEQEFKNCLCPKCLMEYSVKEVKI